MMVDFAEEQGLQEGRASPPERLTRGSGVAAPPAPVQVQVPPEQVWGAAQACPQLPQFFGSELVSVHDDPQQATGQVICFCHCPRKHVWSSVPTHCIWPGAQTPVHWPLKQVCPTQGAPHTQLHGHIQGVLPTHCFVPTTHVLQQIPFRQGAPPQDIWLCQWPLPSQSCGVSPRHWA